MQLNIPVLTVEFDPAEREEWRAKNGHTNLFGETMAGRYYESLGYKVVYKGFNLFGGNRPDKWPEPRELLIAYYGQERFDIAQTIYPTYKVIEPDLMIYKPDLSEIRFAEVKRTDTHDKLDPRQARALGLIALLLGSKAELVRVHPKGQPAPTESEIWQFPEAIRLTDGN